MIYFVTGEEVKDFGTEGKKDQPIKETYNVKILTPGIYNITFTLSNEVSSTTVSTQVNYTHSIFYLIIYSLYRC